MSFRKFAATIAVVSSVALGTTGCSITSNITSQLPYAPSDGSNATVDGVKALNLIYLTNPISNDSAAPEVGGLIGTFVNTTSSAVEVKLQFNQDLDNSSGSISPQVTDWTSASVAPGGTLFIGYNDNPAIAAILLDSKNNVAKPGSLVTVFFDGKAVEVPVLDGTLAQYAPILAEINAGPAEPAN